MLDKITNNIRINLQFKVIALISLIALGFASLGGELHSQPQVMM